MIDIRSKCGEVFHADEKFVGQKIRCPKCGEILTIQFPEALKTQSSEPIKTPPFTYTTRTQKTNYKPTRKFKNDLKRVAPLLIFLLIASVIVIGYLTSENKSSPVISSTPISDNSNNSNDYANRPETGNVYEDNAKESSPAKNSTPTSTKNKKHFSAEPKSYSDNSNFQPIAPKKIKPPVDPYADWDKVDLRTGTSPGCFNFKPTYDFALDNKLEISVGSNTDVVIKLCSYTTGKCIRYIYVRSGDTYNITNIPQDRYYTKIAYGSDWRQKIVDGECEGKFVHNALYKKGEQVLDYHKEYNGTTTDGDYITTHYNLPSFSLSLNVVSTDFDPNTYNTNSISEEEFNK